MPDLATSLLLIGPIVLIVLVAAFAKPALAVFALIVPGLLAWAGYRSFGWRGVAINVGGFVLISLIMYLIGGGQPDDFYPAYRGG